MQRTIADLRAADVASHVFPILGNKKAPLCQRVAGAILSTMVAIVTAAVLYALDGTEAVAQGACQKYLPNIGRTIDVPCETGDQTESAGDTGGSDAPVQECDRLAAFPSDRQRVTEGIEFTAMDGAQALTACREATQRYPAVRRFKYQLARALDRTGDYAQAVSLYRSLADGGYAAAMNNLGTMYADGTGVAKDLPEALRWYRKGADAGNSTAINNVGLVYLKGEGVAKDEAEAVRWFRKGADAGDAEAMNSLASMYCNGTGVAKDCAEGIRWYRKGADNGNTLAMSNLGTIYQNGQGVAQDEVEAVRWYRKGAEAGGTDAMGGLASMLANGRGVARDPSAASQWMFKALKGGDEWAREQMTTNASAWDNDFRTQFQERLKEAGLYTGEIDGQFGPGVMGAIAALRSRASKP